MPIGVDKMREDVNEELMETAKDEEEIEDLNNSIRVVVSSTMGYWMNKQGNNGFRAAKLDEDNTVRLNKTIREKHHAYERILSLLACNPSYLHAMYKKYILPGGDKSGMEKGMGRETTIQNHEALFVKLVVAVYGIGDGNEMDSHIENLFLSLCKMIMQDEVNELRKAMSSQEADGGFLAFVGKFAKENSVFGMLVKRRFRARQSEGE